MGYYTKFDLTTIPDDYNAEIYEKEVRSYTDYSDLFGDAIKWYTHQEDMKKLSKKFPEIVFCLSGEGEESGDIWKEYYQNGKIFKTVAKIVFEDFDPEKLE